MRLMADVVMQTEGLEDQSIAMNRLKRVGGTLLNTAPQEIEACIPEMKFASHFLK